MFKKTLLVISLCIIAMTGVYAQTSKVSPDEVGAEWQPYLENDKVLVEVKKSDCIFKSDGIAQRWILFRFTNKTSAAVQLNYEYDLYYNEICKTCGSDEYYTTISMAPKEVIEGECNIHNNRYYKYAMVEFLDMKRNKKLTGFHLNNLSVK